MSSVLYNYRILWQLKMTGMHSCIFGFWGVVRTLHTPLSVLSPRARLNHRVHRMCTLFGDAVVVLALSLCLKRLFRSMMNTRRLSCYEACVWL